MIRSEVDRRQRAQRCALHQLPERAMARFIAWALAIVCAIATLITLVPRFWSMSIDLATHYTFVNYIGSNLDVMQTGGPEMNLYPGGEIMPQAGHAAAAIAGMFSGSFFLGMQILLFVSILIIWTSIYSLIFMLGPRLGLIAAIIMSGTILVGNVARPLGSTLQVHGWEVIVNFFFTHTIAQGLFWFSVRARLGWRTVPIPPSDRRGIGRRRAGNFLRASSTRRRDTGIPRIFTVLTVAVD